MHLARLDAELEAAGSHPVDLPWDCFELDTDGDHFTLAGGKAFAQALATRVPRGALVVADSTVAHNAIALVAKAVGAVDAVCGSGFVARAEYGEHFHARAARVRADNVVFVGGWNDVRQCHHDLPRVYAAARACVRRTARGSRGATR